MDFAGQSGEDLAGYIWANLAGCIVPILLATFGAYFPGKIGEDLAGYIGADLAGFIG